MKNEFFTQFLMISDLRTMLLLVVFVVMLSVLIKLPKQRFKFSAKVTLGTLGGLLLGLGMQVMSGFAKDPLSLIFIKETIIWLDLIGNGFIDLIRMLVIPLIMISIIHVLIHLDQKVDLKRLVSRSMLTMFLMVAIAAFVGVMSGLLFNVGTLQTNIEGSSTIKTITPIAVTFRNLIPANPIQAMIDGNIVGLVLFSAFFGMGAKRMHKKYSDIIEPFYQMIDAAYKIIISVAMTIIKAMPYGVLALIASTIAQRGMAGILDAGKFILALYAACLFMLMVQLLLLALFKVNPITYLRKGAPLLFLAFTSRSSVGVLAATIETLTDKLGVSQASASLVASFSTTAAMQGCAGVFPAMLIVYVAHSCGISMDISMIFMTVLVVAFASVGIAGIPGTATMAASVSLSGMGLSAYFPLVTPILAIDPIIDMMRTMLNVSGTLCNAILVDRQMKTMDMQKFNQSADLNR